MEVRAKVVEMGAKVVEVRAKVVEVLAKLLEVTANVVEVEPGDEVESQGGGGGSQGENKGSGFGRHEDVGRTNVVRVCNSDIRSGVGGREERHSVCGGSEESEWVRKVKA